METLTLFKILDAKLAYVSQRQSVLADNIANANTSGFRPSDVIPPDFKKIMQGQADRNGPEMTGLAMTNREHLAALNFEPVSDSAKFRTVETTYEVKPSGNAVDLEEQMLKASRNQLDANTVINMYVKQLSLLRTAIGANGR